MPASKVISSGILVYKKEGADVLVLLVHPGGPYWAKKDLGAWSVPKGECQDGEKYLDAAKREFKEEMGLNPPEGDYFGLGEVKLKNGKMIHVWSVEGDLKVDKISSNKITIDWPPQSGKKLEIPEIDRAEWVSVHSAIAKMHNGQGVFIERLAERLGVLLKSDDPNGPNSKHARAQQSLF